MTGDGQTTVVGGNVAHGSMVGSQVTVVHGDLNISASPDDSLADRFRIARALLDREERERAEEVIADAIAREPWVLTADAAYLRVLTILHGRSVGDLDEAERRRIDDCFARISEYADDMWREALDVLQELVACRLDQERQRGRLDAGRFDRVMDRLARLPNRPREEIGRHLGVLLNEARSDRADGMLAELVDEHRMAGDRRRRVPLFFEPEPVQPCMLPDEPPPRFGARVRIARYAGTVVAAAGALLVLATAARARPLAAAAAVALWVWSGFLLWRDGWDLLYRRWRRRRKTRDVRGHTALGAWDPPVSTPFAAAVEGFVRRWFVTEPPIDSAWARRRFAAETAGLQARLRDEIVQLYAGRVRPERVEWLVRWHAGQAARRWEDGTLYGPRLSVPPAVRLRVASGLVALSAGCLLALYAALPVDAVHTVLAAALLGAGGRAAFVSHMGIVCGLRVHTDDRREREQRFCDEQLGYAQRKAELKERPDDTDMSRWLHWDRVHLRLLAMRTLGLSAEDLVTSFVLAEGQGGLRARIGNGPLRYLEYTLRAFLLTDNGVREIQVRLDFTSGALNDEQRTSFPYRAISWVHMGERTVRAKGRRQTAEFLGARGGPATRRVRSQKLAVTLAGGKEVTIHTRHEAEVTADGDADMDWSSGEDSGDVVAALRFLEAVGADGSAWVRRERRRRQQSPPPGR